jgi:hypothetical protein
MSIEIGTQCNQHMAVVIAPRRRRGKQGVYEVGTCHGIARKCEELFKLIYDN